MIKVTFTNGIGLLYNVEDWFKLRTKYRIIGEFLGVSRTSSIALPLALCPEEALLLIKKGVITLYRWNKLYIAPTIEDQTKYEIELKQFIEEQDVILREERKLQIISFVDQIIKGKKRKEGCNLTREQIIQEELQKLPKLLPENVVNPIYTQHPDYLRDDPVEIYLEELLTYTTKVKSLVYEDLWSRGYYITSGRKFGGDFLVYFGDPVTFHAVYIVKCIENIEQSRNVTEIVAFGRLGNAVKKKYVLAAIEEGKVSYLSLSWIDTEFN